MSCGQEAWRCEMRLLTALLMAAAMAQTPADRNGIFRQYTGWYEMNPADLKAGSNELALQLTAVVLSSEPGNAEAKRVRAAALNRLGDVAANTVERDIYRGPALPLAAAQ